MRSLLWNTCLLASLSHQTCSQSTQTAEDCYERILNNVVNNPSVDLPPEALEHIFAPCEHQQNPGNQSSPNGTGPGSIFDDRRYESAQIVFDDYHQFLRYTPQSSMSNGIYTHMKQIIEWVMNSAMRDVVSFDAHIGYAVLRNVKDLSFLKEQISFSDKQLFDYLHSLMSGINERQLWALSSNFGNKQFESIDIERLLLRYSSFGGGGGFGVQIFCDSELIWNGGAGGGGGYNSEDEPAFQYGGGGGIQLNNDSVSVGGGTGHKHSHHWIIDANANVPQFYGVESEKFKEMLRDNNKCTEIRVQSGGGGGAGFNRHSQDSNLLGFTEYSLNFVLGDTPKMTYISRVLNYLSVMHELITELV